ncbi:MAG: hypothetical protein AAGJ18_28990 [Bacteroidota bacterium]
MSPIKNLQKVDVKRIQVPYESPATMTRSTYETASTNLAIAYGETIILAYTFAEPVTFDKKLAIEKYYAGNTLRPIQANKTLTYEMPKVQIGEEGTAIVRVSIGRNLAKNRRPVINVNGLPVTYKVDVIRGYGQHTRKNFFGTLEIPLPYELLQNGANQIQVTFPDDGGHVSSVILQVATLTSNTNKK